MKLSILAASLVIAAPLAFAQGPAANLHQAASATAFTDSIGVVTHFAYTNTPYYTSPTATINAIKAMQIRHIRDGFILASPPASLAAIHAQLKAAGIGADLIVPNPGTTTTLAAMQAALKNYPDAEAIEDPNEYDNAGVAAWAANLKAFLPTVYSFGHGAGLPVYGPSLVNQASYATLGNVAAQMTCNNYHAYYGGRAPENAGWGGWDAYSNAYGALAWGLDLLAVTAPNTCALVTETGWVVSATPAVNVIPPAVEAIYEPRLLLHNFNLGIKRTYIYELMDEPSSTTGFGLMDATMTARPAHSALVYLMTFLADSVTVPAPNLAYTLTGSLANIETTLLYKSDGHFVLCLWNTSGTYDVNAMAAIAVPNQSVILTLTGGQKAYSYWTFNGAGNYSTGAANSASATLSIGSGVTLVQIY